jgi:hypothetical protein
VGVAFQPIRVRMEEGSALKTNDATAGAGIRSRLDIIVHRKCPTASRCLE